MLGIEHWLPENMALEAARGLVMGTFEPSAESAFQTFPALVSTTPVRDWLDKDPGSAISCALFVSLKLKEAKVRL
jgi:hypothetical protein